MKSRKQLEYLGWGFFAVAFAVLVAPMIYLTWRFTYDLANNATRVGIGVVLAVVAAGLITWPINEFVTRRHAKRVAQVRKQQRKDKKRRGKR